MGDVIPLATPFTLLIDPTNACNFKCTFCPTGDKQLLKKVGRPIGLMNFDLFRKIIDDLDGFEHKLKKLQLYKDGEPLLNKQLPKMIAYAKSRGVAEVIETTTNGSLITPKIAEAIIDSGLDRIRISVEHVSNMGYREITKTEQTYDAILDNIRLLHKTKKQKKSSLHIHTKIVDSGLTEYEKQKFYSDFSPFSDTMNVDGLMDWGGADTHGRVFSLSTNPERSINNVEPLSQNRLVCSAPFKGMAINFNGQASVCCVDWSLETIVGNVAETSILEIWNGEAMRNFRIKHLRGLRSQLTACASCKYMQGFSKYEDIDGKSHEILRSI